MHTTGALQFLVMRISDVVRRKPKQAVFFFFFFFHDHDFASVLGLFIFEDLNCKHRMETLLDLLLFFWYCTKSKR